MKIYSSKLTDPEKKKKDETTAASKGSKTGVWTKRETPKRGFGGSQNVGDYGSAPSPGVGGKAPKASGLKGASKKQVKASKSMVRKGTGDGASKAARMASLRSHRR